MLSPEKYSNPKDLTYYFSCTTSQTTELWTCKGHIADLYWCKRNVCLHSSRSGYLRQAFYYPKITKLLSLQRCVACEVRVNLNYSTEVHFTLLYWFKSRTWQCKSNRACVKVTESLGNNKHDGWSCDGEKCIQDYIHPDFQTLQSTIEMAPGFKPFTYCAFCSSKL